MKVHKNNMVYSQNTYFLFDYNNQSKCTVTKDGKFVIMTPHKHIYKFYMKLF